MARKARIGFCGTIAAIAAIIGFQWIGSVVADTASEVVEESSAEATLPGPDEGKEPTSPPDAGPRDIQVPPPPFTEDMFPCMECHEIIDPNPERRALEEFHEEILLNHDEENRWCLDCHDSENRDVLRLASGKTVSFDESYLLCAQCHGPKFRDWKAGVHGKRMGRWDGKERSYLLCVHCHNPHDPQYPHIHPMPKPEAPHLTRELMNRPAEPIDLPGPLPKRASGVVDDEEEEEDL